MTGWMELPNIAMTTAALVLMSLGLLMAVISRVMEEWVRRFFLLFFSVLLLSTVCSLADQLMVPHSGLMVLNKLALYLSSLLSSLLLPMLTLYLLRCCGEDWRGSALFGAVMALWGVYFLLLGITQFTTFIYYFTPDNQYFRGPLYPLLLAPPVLIMAVNLFGLIRRRAQLNRRHFLAFLIYLTMPMAGMLIQMYFFGLLLVGLGTAIAALHMFVIILFDQMSQYARQQQELARQRASVMVLQMRPHFICNTMMSIYYLCRQDPEKAQQVTLDFTNYLRKNFTAIASETTIPFTEELEHTRAYLAVEQAQFEDGLFVEFDTPLTRFRVPPLTLQPIVENAVKHGMDPDLEALRILIRTRETPAGSEITVQDNGPGYEPANDNEPHIALANIRDRLKMMCGGELTITCPEEGGTVVTVIVPYEKKAPSLRSE